MMTDQPEIAIRGLEYALWGLAAVVPVVNVLLLPVEWFALPFLVAHGVPYAVLAGRARHDQARPVMMAAVVALAGSCGIWLWMWRDQTHVIGGADIGLGIACLAFPVVIALPMVVAHAIGTSHFGGLQR